MASMHYKKHKIFRERKYRTLCTRKADINNVTSDVDEVDCKQCLKWFKKRTSKKETNGS